jgi:transcriptional regulator with XRE-family HTH domain
MKKETLKQMASRLREFRKRHGLKQDDYAVMAGLKRAAISRMETGGSKPSFGLLYNLRQKYNLSIDWLISGEGPMHRSKTQNPDFGEFSPTFREMIENMQRNKALMHAVFSAYHTKLVEIELLKSRTPGEEIDD